MRITISVSIDAAGFTEIGNSCGCMSLTSADGSHDLFVHGTPEELRAFTERMMRAVDAPQEQLPDWQTAEKAEAPNAG